MEKPLVSVLLNSYNGQEFIVQQINSILQQTFSDFELIIYDDHSTDETYNIALNFSKNDDRIILYQSPKNQRLTPSYRHGLTFCRGKYICLADNDNFWLPDRLKIQVDYLNANQDIGLVYSDCFVCDQHLNITHQSFLKELKGRRFSIQKTDTKSNTLSNLLEANHIPGITVMFRSDLKRYTIPDSAIHDQWLSLVGSTFSKIGFIDQPLVKYRQHSQNMVGAGLNNNSLYIKSLTGQGTFKNFVSSKTKYIDVLNSLLSFLDKKDPQYLIIHSKIVRLNQIIKLAQSDGFIAFTKSSFSIIFSGIYYRNFLDFKYIPYFLMLSIFKSRFSSKSFLYT